MAFQHILEFLTHFFTHLNRVKVIGGLLVLAGGWLITNMAMSGNPNSAILMAIAGIIIAGVGAVIIYYDMAKDKLHGNYSPVDTLNKTFEQQQRDKQEASGWHMNHDHDKKP